MRTFPVASPQPAIDRVELVSLLTDDQSSVYVLDEMATPPLARQAKRRPLDEFERLGLDAVRRGEELVWTRDVPTRMFGLLMVTLLSGSLFADLVLMPAIIAGPMGRFFTHGVKPDMPPPD